MIKPSSFAFPSHIPQPIDSSLLRTIIQSPSLDDLRSHAASPCSLKGVYVRSRATSPTNDSEENLNMIFHPEDGHTEYEFGPRRVTFDSHLATSFASFAGTQKEGLFTSASTSASEAPLFPCTSVYTTWESPTSARPPPGYSLKIDAGDDVIIYMAEERLKARAEAKAPSVHGTGNDATILPSVPSTVNHTPEISGRNPRSQATASSIPGNESTRKSNDVERPHTTVTFAIAEDREHTLKRMPRIQNLSNLRTPQLVVDIPATEHQPQEPSAVPSFFDDGDNHMQSPQLIKKKALSRVIKVIKKKWNAQSSHRKVDSSDVISIKSAAVFSAPVEKVKSSSASMFDIGATGHAPSIRSTHTTMTSKSKKKVLVKPPRNSSKSKTGTQETALLTSSTRAIENKTMRRRSASFSGYINVVQPDTNQWTLPEDLDNELIQEAFEVLAKQTADDWVYKARNRDSASPATKYIVERRER